jgi:hypothetical protein
MLTPGDRELARYPTDLVAGLGSPDLNALAVALGKLLETSDGVAEAVTRHDRAALLEYNERADSLLAEVGRLSAGLSDSDRALLPEFGVPALCKRLAAGSRRNALLIEQAWATDAALMRLLLGLGRVGPSGIPETYSSGPAPTYVDRQA